MRKTCLKKEQKVSNFWSWESLFLQYFRRDSSFVYCHNKCRNWEFQCPTQMNGDCSLTAQNIVLKCILLRKSNLYSAVPIGHSVCLHEEHGDTERVSELLQYHKHNWNICVNLKIVCFFLGQQCGYTKYPYFLSMWDSRA